MSTRDGQLKAESNSASTAALYLADAGMDDTFGSEEHYLCRVLELFLLR